jgi:fructose-1-phosphate kinase PfkB-like protein
MALALNVFKTVTSVVGTSATSIYTAPVGYTGVVLLAQVANIGSTNEDVSLTHRRSSTDTEMLKEFPISANDTANLLSGKLVLESGDKLVLSGSNASNLKFVASILETLN